MSAVEKDKDLDYFEQLDQRLVEVASYVKVLSSIAWPLDAQFDFLRAWQFKKRRLPKVKYPRFDQSEVIAELRSIIKAASVGHPIGKFLHLTAQSYLHAAQMLDSVGTPAFLELSRRLYGDHDSPVVQSGLRNEDFAEDFIELSDDLDVGIPDELDNENLSPEQVAIQLKVEARSFFNQHEIEIVIDPSLTAKAAAGAQRVRIRGRTAFSQHDVDQLIQHELLVHSATMLNGRLQPHIRSLSLGSPRTTCTQEGLATFAEFITSSIDLNRLRRLALRIKGVAHATRGADFIEVFEFFMGSGQTPVESFQSTARIFRGGDVNGGVFFTKDTVYLKGLFLVHTFLRKAIEARKIEFPDYLFVGRLTVGDVVDLEPYIQSGYIAKPYYRPAWIVNRHRLAAYLGYALMANKLNLKNITLEDFSANEDEALGADE